MVNDFPGSELKPLDRILKGMKKGTYESVGFYDSETKELLAYAVLVKTGADLLLDYFAVTEEYRDQGIGGAFLKRIARGYQNAGSLIAEVEDPDFARNEEERKLQNRRIQFYLRNGFVDTGVKTTLFGVEFMIMESAENGTHSQDKIKEIYKTHYRKILPWILYWRMVKVK